MDNLIPPPLPGERPANRSGSRQQPPYRANDLIPPELPPRHAPVPPTSSFGGPVRLQAVVPNQANPHYIPRQTVAPVAAVQTGPKTSHLSIGAFVAAGIFLLSFEVLPLAILTCVIAFAVATVAIRPRPDRLPLHPVSLYLAHGTRVASILLSVLYIAVLLLCVIIFVSKGDEYLQELGFIEEVYHKIFGYGH